MTAPLQRLYAATKEIGQGNFNVDLTPDSNDEIGALTDSFVVMSKKVQDLLRESVRKAHLENEVAIASTVQQTLLPPPAFQNEFVNLFSHYQSATECGGDWWGYFGVGKKMCFMIADATGHGLPSALITASARSCFSVLQRLAEEQSFFKFSPQEMLSYANRVVFEAASGQIMMTFFVGVVDFEQKTLTYSSAGHNPPWLFKKGAEKYTLKSLTASGMRLGEKSENRDYEEKVVEITPDDILFLYTDGLLEGKNVEGTQYGKKKSRQLVEAFLNDGPRRVIEEVVSDFLNYNEGKDLDDDVTLAVIKMLPSQATT